MIFLANNNSKEIELPKDPTYDELERYSGEVYQQGREDGIVEYKNKCFDEIRKVVEFYEKDKQNRPKPNIKSAIAIMTVQEELMKGINGDN